MSILGIIPARWQSRRFPGKPLANILGKSLIQWTYENSKKSQLLDQVVVATDDQRIFDHVKEFDGEVFMTSKECHTGTDRVSELVQNRFQEGEIVVNIQGDEPCLDPSFIDRLIRKMQQTPEAVLTTLIAKIHASTDIFNPDVVKCVFDSQQRAMYFSRAPIPFPRANYAECDYYRHLGVYCFRRGFLLKYKQFERSPLQEIEDLEQLKVLEHGYPIHCCLVEETIGVDTPDDLKKVENILCHANTSLSQEALSHP